jgi:hypothetical protein
VFVAQALSDIPVSHVAKTFSQLKEEGGNVSTRELKEETFSARELDKLTRLESHAILDEIGALQDTHVDTQVRRLKGRLIRNDIIQSYLKKYLPILYVFILK